MTSGEIPYPPFEMMDRVLRLSTTPDRARAEYERVGGATHSELLRLLPEGYELDGRRLLDFGCGAGRTLRHFVSAADRAEVWGVDIDSASIDWIKANLSPPINAARSGVDPPLPFDDESFDFAWAISVFTHLTDNSADWLLELHRILRPGGLLMASHMGEWTSDVIAHEPWDENRIGMNVLRHDNPWSLGGPMVLMSGWWVQEHWGRAFDITAVNRGFHGQSWVMLEKRDVDLTAEELLEPGDDPREFTALRHNLVQLQAETEQLRRDRDAELESLRRDYEASRSWQATAPLRAATRRFRPGPGTDQGS